MDIVFKICIQNKSSKKVYYSDNGILYTGKYGYNEETDALELNSMANIIGEFKIKEDGQYRGFLDVVELNGIKTKFEIPINIKKFNFREGDTLNLRCQYQMLEH